MSPSNWILYDKWPYEPPSYPDEMLYSVLARLFHHTGSASLKFSGILTDCEHKRAGTVSADLPVRIGITSKMFSSHRLSNPEYIFYNMTLYPYYGFYLPEEKFDQIKESAINGAGSSSRILPSTIKGRRNKMPTKLKFCSKCNEENLQLYGEYYWNRIHQLPYVDICPIHGNFLQLSLVNSRSNLGHYFAATKSSCPPNANKSIDIANGCDYLKVADFAARSLSILNHKKDSGAGNFGRSKLRLLKNSGSAPRSFLVRQVKIATHFNAVFNVFHSNYPDLAKYFTESHLEKFLRGYNSPLSPVYHILFDMLEEHLPFCDLRKTI